MNLLFLFALFSSLLAQSCRFDSDCSGNSVCNQFTNTCTQQQQQGCSIRGCIDGFQCENDVCVPTKETVRNVTNFAIGTLIALVVGGLLICCCCIFCIYRLVKGYTGNKKQNQAQAAFNASQASVPYGSAPTPGQAPYANPNGSVYPPPTAVYVPPSGNGGAPPYAPPSGAYPNQPYGAPTNAPYPAAPSSESYPPSPSNAPYPANPQYGAPNNAPYPVKQ